MERCFIYQQNIAKKSGENKTIKVIVLTLAVMGIEIGYGLAYGSMALLADGWHMGTHAAALGITLFAYRFARRAQSDTNYTFGTHKGEYLGGFTSAIVLGLVAIMMVGESIHRLTEPVAIGFNQSIIVALIGLGVNLLSLLLLKDNHHHGHDHHGHDHTHEDQNLKAAYLHVLADALTSILAIGALILGKYFNLVFLDPLVGILGAFLIGKWAIGLLKSTGKQLLDYNNNPELKQKIIERLQQHATLSDLHIWCPDGKHSCLMLNLTGDQTPQFYKDLLQDLKITHITVEVNPVV